MPEPVCPDGDFGSPIGGQTVATAVATGFHFLEGPVWIGSTLWLSDMDFGGGGPDNVPPSTIYEFDGDDANPVVVDAGSNGLAIDSNSMVIACTHDDRTVSRIDPTTLQRQTVADSYMGMKFNSPNDVAVRGDGTIYFTDPTWQLGNRQQEIPFKGVFRITLADEVVLVADDFGSPNGIALSPGEDTLYVADDAKGLVERFDVATDGSTSGRAEFAMTPGADGLCMDCAGNVYVAAYGGVRIFEPSGTEIGTIEVADKPSNCAFGGADRKTLYVTAGATLYAVDLEVPGLPY